MGGANKTWSLFCFPELNPDCHHHDDDQEEEEEDQDDDGEHEDCDDDNDVNHDEEDADVPQPALDDVLLGSSELPGQLRLHRHKIQHLRF